GVANARAYAHQREAAARAASRAAELEALLESMTDGVLLVDEAGQVTSANRAAATILGRPDGLVRASLTTVLAGLRSPDGAYDLAARAPADLALALRSSSAERELVGEIDGAERVMALEAMPVGGQGNGTLIVVRDVTDRRLSDERAAQAEKLRALG